MTGQNGAPQSTGLTSAEATARLAQVGPNQLRPHRQAAIANKPTLSRSSDGFDGPGLVVCGMALSRELTCHKKREK